MTRANSNLSRPGRWAGLVAGLLLAGATTVSAQGPSGPPPGGLPPGGPPPGAQSGPPPGAPALGGPPPTSIPLTPAQELVASLTPPGPGGLFPQTPPGPNDPVASAEPRDLTGTWYHAQPLEFRIQRDMYNFHVPYTMDGARVLERRVRSLDNGTPFLNASAICRPPGQQWQLDLTFPFQIVQGDGYLEFIFEEYHGRWNIVMDPARFPRPAQPEYMGYSVGHWDGSTLVVETDGYRQSLWLDVNGTPLSADGRMIHRIRKVDNGDGKPFLEIATTFVDPRLYTRPWTVVRNFSWQSNIAIMREYDCEEQIGDPNVDADAGLVPEPAGLPGQ